MSQASGGDAPGSLSGPPDGSSPSGPPSDPLADDSGQPERVFPRESREKEASWDSAEREGKVQYGEDFGKMGKYVKHPNIKVDWSQYHQHGLEQMKKRGLTREMVDEFVKNGKVLSQNNGKKFVFVTREGVSVVTREGKLITAWGEKYFDVNMTQIIKILFGD